METFAIFDADTGCYNEEYFIHRLRKEKKREKLPRKASPRLPSPAPVFTAVQNWNLP
jgi:hypothetical protein